nr:MAG TPA: hypothetical protein [Caudoviricetes sp.]
MDEYIDKEAFKHKYLCCGYLEEISENEFDNFPAADVAPVVRCKGCKYSCKDRNGRTCEGYWYELSEFAVPVKDDDFCSYGEPMMDGGADHEAD